MYSRTIVYSGPTFDPSTGFDSVAVGAAPTRWYARLMPVD